MKKRTSNLLSFYGNPFQQGIFFSMYQSNLFSDIFTPLNCSTEEDFHQMDMDYIYNRSGFKTLSIMLKALYDGYVVDDSGDLVELFNGQRVTYDRVVTELDKQIINGVIFKKFHDKWKKLTDTLSVQYDILKPFDIEMTEDRNNDNLTSGGGVTRTYNTTDSSTLGTETQTTETDSKFAFNSETDIPTDKSNILAQNSGTDTMSKSGTVGDDTDYHRLIEKERHYTRKGNIGNHTNQQLINEEREMLKFQIFDTIYDDLDSVLTLSKYN